AGLGCCGNFVCRLDIDQRGLIIALVYVHNRPPYQPGRGFGVNVYRESERTEIGILLHKFDLLDEEGRRLNNAAGCAEQLAGLGVQINSASEKSYTLLAR